MLKINSPRGVSTLPECSCLFQHISKEFSTFFVFRKNSIHFNRKNYKRSFEIMEFSEIIDTFGKVAAFHSGNKDMLYFGEGSKEGIEACKRALFLLKQSADFTVFKKQTAVAYHKIFPIIKNHFDQIRQNYLNNEEKLLFVLLKKLVPGKLNPLKFKVLSQMSLCSAPVQLNSSLFKPAPITGFVDGYYNFVIPVGGSIIRIPLIPKDGVTPVALPPSIRFVGSDKEKKNAQDFIVNRAPKIGRIYQFNAFVSTLNRSDPRLGPVNEFKDALTSFDLSFATALAALSYDNLSKRYLNNMIKFFFCKFSHFSFLYFCIFFFFFFFFFCKFFHFSFL